MVKRLGNFLKTTVLGGFFALLPVVLVIELLGKAMQLAEKATAPLVSLFPQFIIQELKFPILLAIVFLGLTCFVAGLLVHVGSRYQRVGRALFAAALTWLPGHQRAYPKSKRHLGGRNLQISSPGLRGRAEGTRLPD
jgi:uncharacterized membrane protein